MNIKDTQAVKIVKDAVKVTMQHLEQIQENQVEFEKYLKDIQQTQRELKKQLSEQCQQENK